MPVISGRNVNTSDVGIVGGGAVLLISSFLPWYGASGGGFSASVSGWSAGFTAWFSILLGIAVAGAVAARVFGDVRLPAAGGAGPALILTGVATFAVLLILLRLLTLPSGGGFTGFSYGPRIGLFLGLIGAAVEAVFGFLSFRTSGETLPGGRRL